MSQTIEYWPGSPSIRSSFLFEGVPVLRFLVTVPTLFVKCFMIYFLFPHSLHPLLPWLNFHDHPWPSMTRDFPAPPPLLLAPSSPTKARLSDLTIVLYLLGFSGSDVRALRKRRWDDGPGEVQPTGEVQALPSSKRFMVQARFVWGEFPFFVGGFWVGKWLGWLDGLVKR